EVARCPAMIRAASSRSAADGDGASWGAKPIRRVSATTKSPGADRRPQEARGVAAQLELPPRANEAVDETITAGTVRRRPAPDGRKFAASKRCEEQAEPRGVPALLRDGSDVEVAEIR